MRDNFAVDSFHTRNFVADFLRKSRLLDENGPFCVFDPFRGLEAAYDVHLGLIRKCVVDFLLVIIELFFARSKG